jgi:hypothetical protein
MTYTHEYLHQVYQNAIEKAARTGKNKDYADVDETSALLGMESDDLQEICDFILFITHAQISTAVEKGMVDDDDYNEIMNTAVVNAAASALILARGLQGASRMRDEPAADRYPVTLLAEARIRNHLADRADLNDIWPLPLAEEVVSEFEPVHAFLVGVVCGSHDG